LSRLTGVPQEVPKVAFTVTHGDHTRSLAGLFQFLRFAQPL